MDAAEVPTEAQVSASSATHSVAVDRTTATGTQRTVNRDTLSFPEKHGSWLLASGSAVAWILAVAETTAAVATTFAVAGSLLLAAAAFYSRVVRITKDGVDLADVVDVIQGVAIEDGDTPADAKVRAIEGVQRLALATGESASTSRGARPGVRRAMMERERVEANLRSYFVAWLQQQGYTIVQDHPDRDGIRTDMVAERASADGRVERIFIELRPAVAVLRASDAAAIAARKPAAGYTDGARRALVLRDEAIVMPDAEQRLLDEGTTLFKVDVDGGVVREQAPPRFGSG